MDDWTVDFIAEGEDNFFHLPNDVGEDFRRVFVRSPNESSPLSMRIKLVEVHHGEMIHEGEDCHASLLVFEMRFQSKLQERRYQSVSVTLEFFDKGGNKRRNPVVVDWAPDRTHWLNKTTYDRTTKSGASVEVKAGIPLVSGGPNVHWDVENTRPLHFKATLTGEPHSSKGQNAENGVVWSMQENKDEATGIPSFLQTTVLLKRVHTGPFFAKLRVKSAVDLLSAARRSFPMTTDNDKIIDPVTFTPGKTQVKSASTTGIKEEDLVHMESLPIKEYFKVNLSEEDPLSPPAAASLQVLSTLSQNDPAPATAAPPTQADITVHNEHPTPVIPTIEQKPNRNAPHKESLAPDDAIQTTDRKFQTQSPSLAAPSTVRNAKITENVVLQAETPPTATQLELALAAISKAAEAAKAASEAAQVAAKAAHEAFEAVARAAEAVVKAAEEKQV